jgi:hypothetical protein
MRIKAVREGLLALLSGAPARHPVLLVGQSQPIR